MGRRRICCSDRCRKLAYTERLEDRYDREPDEAPQPVPGSVLDRILEDHRYQHAVNQLIVTFFILRRMSEGTYQLPIVV